LEEAVVADILIHVVDAANPQVMTHMNVVYETLTNLGAKDKAVITVFNKMDKRSADLGLRDAQGNPHIYISAKTGEGFAGLIKQIELEINAGKRYIKATIPYDQGNVLQIIREYGQIKVEDYREDGTYIEAYLEEALVNKFGL
jgi:GTP-binding protein HflX